MTKTEKLLSQSARKEVLLNYLNVHPESVEEVIQIALTTTLPQCWRACWLLFHYCESEDIRLIPHRSELIKAIANKSDGHQRELIKLIGRMDLDEDHEGRLFDQCMSIWESVKKKPSVRMMAFRYIVTVVKKYPELWGEVVHLTQPHYLDSLTPGVLNSVTRQIEQLRNTSRLST